MIPELYKHLVDYESNLVRSTAIGVFGQLLGKAVSSIPESMVDLLVEVHLRDPYKIIHKAAVAALRSYKFTRDRRGYVALGALLTLEAIHSEEGKDTRFLEELVGVLRSAFADWVEVRRYVALSILPRYAGHPDPYFSKHMITTLSYDVQEFPEIRRVFLQVVLDFFQRAVEGASDPRSVPDLLRSLSLVPLPVFYFEVRDPIQSIREELGVSEAPSGSDLTSSPTEVPIVKMLFFLDGHPWLTLQAIKSGVQYDFGVQISLSRWPGADCRLEVDCVSIADPRTYHVTSFDVSAEGVPGVIWQQGHLIFYNPQVIVQGV